MFCIIAGQAMIALLQNIAAAAGIATVLLALCTLALYANADGGRD